MNFRYTYRTTGLDLWQLSMYYTYGSVVGVCNVIFTVAAWILTVTRWETSGNGMRCLLVLACCLFPVIQPFLVYLKAGRQARGIQTDTELVFDDRGVHVKTGGQSSDLPWKTIKRISKKPTMIIVFSDTTHGFVLTNRVLGTEKEAFYDYITSKMKK